MRYKIETSEQLILRDGRPFGDVGTFGGYSVNWPYPQTIAGMFRTLAGFDDSEDYFDKNNPNFKANIENILQIGMQKILPMQRSSLSEASWEPLLPLPADILFTQTNDVTSNQLNVTQMVYRKLADEEATDILNREWLFPFIDVKNKAARNQPFFCHWDFYQKYLDNQLLEEDQYLPSQIGVSAPIVDERIHNALDATSLTTEEGKLFANSGFYFRTNNKTDSTINLINLIELSIHFTANKNLSRNNKRAYLGGERKTVTLSKTEIPYPVCPQNFSGKKWLKIVLTTHGDFGSWAPDWLRPNLNASTIGWLKIPDTKFMVRLRSACIHGWDAVSGWDYVKQQPKATKKLVKPGAVYLIELENASHSQELAEHLWGNSLCEVSSEARLGGYGQCVVANAHVEDLNS